MSKRARLGDVEFSVVESEKPRDSVTITDNSVEKGQDVSDHVKQQSTVLDLVGVFVGDDAPANLQKLRKYQKEGELLTYIGRNVYDNMVLEIFDRDHNMSIANGFYYNITLKQIRLASAKTVEIKVANPVTKKPSKKTGTQVKKKTSKGKQQTKSTVISGPSQPKSNTKAPYRTETVNSYVTKKKKETPLEKMNGLANTFGVPPRPKREVFLTGSAGVKFE